VGKEYSSTQYSVGKDVPVHNVQSVRNTPASPWPSLKKRYIGKGLAFSIPKTTFLSGYPKAGVKMTTRSPVINSHDEDDSFLIFKKSAI
jgi:hypothetical protein